MAEGASPPSGLAPELQTLQGDALLLWSDVAARRRAIEAIVTALDSSDRELAEAVARVDVAVEAGMQALGLPRGPVQRVLIEGGLGPAGRKEADCTLVLGGEQMRALLKDPVGPDSTFRTWVHESIHARQPYAVGHYREYLPRRGFEEGLAEGLARMLVRDKARMAPVEASYQYYVMTYRALAVVSGVDLEQLWRRLWLNPVGRVRGAFPQVVDDLRRTSEGQALTRMERLRLEGVADQLFDSSRWQRAPDAHAIMTTWRTVFR